MELRPLRLRGWPIRHHRAAGTAVKALPEAFRAIGLHQTMYVIPLLSALLGLVL